MKKRDVMGLKIWLLKKNISHTAIAKATGEDRSYTTKTINGSRNNKVVLQYLLNRGCPKRYLEPLPKDMTKIREKTK